VSFDVWEITKLLRRARKELEEMPDGFES